MNRVAFTNARILDPDSGFEGQGALLVDNGKIAVVISRYGAATSAFTISVLKRNAPITLGTKIASSSAPFVAN